MSDTIKQIQRSNSISIRSKLPSSYQIAASEQVCKRIIPLNVYRQAKHIALYQAIGGEISLKMIWNSAPMQGKYCYFPVISEANETQLIFLPATPGTAFKKNRFGILEPDVGADQAIPQEKLDLVFMPLVGFDIYGTRLGMGKGYYDRSLAGRSHKMLIGVGYEFQKQDYIRPEPWDIPLSLVVTDSQIYHCERGDT